jgi:hypothetical protein
MLVVNQIQTDDQLKLPARFKSLNNPELKINQSGAISR